MPNAKEDQVGSTTPSQKQENQNFRKSIGQLHHSLFFMSCSNALQLLNKFTTCPLMLQTHHTHCRAPFCPRAGRGIQPGIQAFSACPLVICSFEQLHQMATNPLSTWGIYIIDGADGLSCCSGRAVSCCPIGLRA